MKNLLMLLLAGALALASIEAHALADGPGCAVVMKTPDGFLNLRAEITTSARIITKLLPGDRLYVKMSEAGISGVGDWAEVDGVWRLDGNNSSKPRHSGWVARRFIRQIKCPAEMQEGQKNKREGEMATLFPTILTCIGFLWADWEFPVLIFQPDNPNDACSRAGDFGDWDPKEGKMSIRYPDVVKRVKAACYVNGDGTADFKVVHRCQIKGTIDNRHGYWIKIISAKKLNPRPRSRYPLYPSVEPSADQ